MKLAEQQEYTQAFERRVKETQWKNGMITQGMPGHTKEASSFPEVHAGRETAAYYAAGIMSGRLGAEEGALMLEQLGRLQETNPDSPEYGGFRWYREETAIHDTNAAFFIMSPLAIVALLFPEQVPNAHRLALLGMMEGARDWFARECRDPILYYPNKIISDGALLLALAKLTEHEGRFEEGEAFFDQWLEYTHRRGWGWGENMSLVYLVIIVNSLQLAAYCLKERRPALARELCSEIRKLLELVRFHEGEEFVPAIRSYNFLGEVVSSSVIWKLAGYETDDKLMTGLSDLWMLPGVALYRGYTDAALGMPAPERQPVPRVRRERVMDDAHAYTWVGARSRLGSLTRFPVLAGCYQWPTWGLGWQSFPVSFSVAGEQVGYLRWSVTENGAVRTHPAESQPKAYLSPALFGEAHYPDVETRCAQAENALLAVRSMTGLNNRVQEIADEWIVQRFRYKAEWIEARGLDGVSRRWAAMLYPGVTVALAALQGIAFGGTDPALAAGELEMVRDDGDTIRIRRLLYRGEDHTVVHPRLESAWAVVIREHAPSEPLDRGELVAWLERIDVRDDAKADGETPRAPHQLIRRISLGGDGIPPVRLELDPYIS
ncbi:hypothetical protein KZ483_01500 [Paenibacillus sp. sptzw28]|uniref:hypothetical protein n=1 Tax=Paenibacillus sp. sptzw28 TaxID=715179 RepID=UPI001C6F0B2E|nr:hypothetical protein [Paenibacillus sp. sptzw28]QYR21749.1 hypothetical protein KZ483_01500 [Paenibacillus sp. sptzw28]